MTDKKRTVMTEVEELRQHIYKMGKRLYLKQWY